MTSARDEMLARVRIAVAGAPALPVPERRYRAAGDVAASLPRLVQRLLDYRAVVHQVTSHELPRTLAGLARGPVVVPHGVPVEWLSGIDVVRDEPTLAPADLDRVGAALTTCALAIAETGTVVLDGGPGQGRRAVTTRSRPPRRRGPRRSGRRLGAAGG